ncbi:MAG: hypothetical protein LBC76_00910 [Treponema sp.]|jgi:hypothetical protein|nr:hypothetical protein [Treponema sp.]
MILALIGTSAISAGEAFYFEYSIDDNLGSNRYFFSIDHTIDWLVNVTIRKTNGYSSSILRNKLLRVFTFERIIAITTYLAEENLIKNNNISIIKNLILLKLRI